MLKNKQTNKNKTIIGYISYESRVSWVFRNLTKAFDKIKHAVFNEVITVGCP